MIRELHNRLVHRDRAKVLSQHLVAMIPREASVLDVGCGDGLVDRLILKQRSDISIEGIDPFPRAGALVRVTSFNGRTIPHADKSFDAVLFVDALHHAPDPLALLREAARVADKCILIKDHNCDGFGAAFILRLMDFVANAGRGFAWSGNYWPERRWRSVFAELNLSLTEYRTRLGLYPAGASWIFARSFHFIALLGLDVRGSARFQ